MGQPQLLWAPCAISPVLAGSSHSPCPVPTGPCPRPISSFPAAPLGTGAALSAALQPSLDPSASETLPVKNHLTSDTEHEDLKISHDLSTQVPERENSSDSEILSTQQSTVDLGDDFKVVGSLPMNQQESGTPNVATPQVLLPFLQNLCTQVNHLRLKDGRFSCVLNP
uniref:Uncharacterized protein n=1 Tax=Melopsittacus undulatus TaxID=13146 RepID=A0A8C6J6U4_MELUD